MKYFKSTDPIFVILSGLELLELLLELVLTTRRAFGFLARLALEPLALARLGFGAATECTEEVLAVGRLLLAATLNRFFALGGVR